MKPIKIPYAVTRLVRWLNKLTRRKQRLLPVVLSLLVVTSQAQPTMIPTITNTPLDAYWAGTAQTSSDNTIGLAQTGSHNQADLSLPGGQTNRLMLNQTDSQNLVTATLLGTSNNVLLQQHGNDNQLHLVLGGNDNQISIRQDGSDTIAWIGLQQSNTRIGISQKAGANTLTVDNSTADSFNKGIAGLYIEQSGGASAVIQQGKVFGR
ncbi:hypothetical protein [Spirosoma litoris]